MCILGITKISTVTWFCKSKHAHSNKKFIVNNDFGPKNNVWRVVGAINHYLI